MCWSKNAGRLVSRKAAMSSVGHELVHVHQPARGAGEHLHGPRCSGVCQSTIQDELRGWEAK
jgi:hypothetical protein